MLAYDHKLFEKSKQRSRWKMFCINKVVIDMNKEKSLSFLVKLSVQFALFSVKRMKAMSEE